MMMLWCRLGTHSGVGDRQTGHAPCQVHKVGPEGQAQTGEHVPPHRILIPAQALHGKLSFTAFTA